MKNTVSIILPAKNEAESLKKLLPRLCTSFPEHEIIVVDDGSSDATVDVCRQNRARVVSHKYSMGNGAAIKSGARAASGDLLVFMDADGQHDPADIQRLIDKINEGYDLVVGAREIKSHASFARRVGNTFFNRLASLMTGYNIEDLTSGFRAARASHFNQFLYLLPNKFSYPTTSTMAFFRSGFSVAYVPIKARLREGEAKSHIKIFRDGFRFFVIILKIGALFSPMRFFLPVSAFLLLTGLSYYAYTWFSSGRLTNMVAILLLSALFTFLIGIVSEQISALHYKDIELTDEPPDREKQK